MNENGLRNLYIQIFEESPVGIIVANDELNIEKWNKASEFIFGYSENEAKGISVLELAPNLEQKRFLKSLLKNAETNQSVDGFVENKSKTGEKVNCKWHIKFINSNSQKIYICMASDMTEEIKIDKERIRVNKALDQSESMIIMTDEKGLIEYVNQKFIDVTGYTRSEIIGQKTDILSAMKGNHKYFENMWNTIKLGNVWNGEFKNKKKNGENYFCQAKIYPVKEDDKVTGFVSVQWDTTESKRLANKNEVLRNKLFEQDKIASLGLLTSGILHEINNPLGYIQSNVKYLVQLLEEIELKDDELKIDIRDTLSDIDTGVDQVRKIADSFKRYLFRGSDEEKEELDIVNLIQEVLLLSKNEYKYNAICELVYDENIEYRHLVYGSKLKQVIMNLVINAAHAIAKKDLDMLGEIKIELKKEEGILEIKIIDNGYGMNDEIRAKIFDPFFTTKEEGIGTGLGLSVSKKIVEEDHGGKLICESKEGLGTTFYIRI